MLLCRLMEQVYVLSWLESEKSWTSVCVSHSELTVMCSNSCFLCDKKKKSVIFNCSCDAGFADSAIVKYVSCIPVLILTWTCLNWSSLEENWVINLGTSLVKFWKLSLNISMSCWPVGWFHHYWFKWHVSWQPSFISFCWMRKGLCRKTCLDFLKEVHYWGSYSGIRLQFITTNIKRCLALLLWSEELQNGLNVDSVWTEDQTTDRFQSPRPQCGSSLRWKQQFLTERWRLCRCGIQSSWFIVSRLHPHSLRYQLTAQFKTSSSSSSSPFLFMTSKPSRLVLTPHHMESVLC